MRFMISMPMNDLSDEEIIYNRNRIKKLLESEGHEVIDSYITDDLLNSLRKILGYSRNNGARYLGLSIAFMSSADAVYFAKGYSNSRGCRFEYEIAKAYNIPVMYEDKSEDLYTELVSSNDEREDISSYIYGEVKCMRESIDTILMYLKNR